MTFQRLSRAAPEAKALGDTGETFGFALARAWMRFHDDYAALLQPLNLSPNRMLALAFVMHNPGADQTSLGRALGINRASTMALIDKLEADGFVRREPGANRRSNAVHATDVGQSSYRKAMQLERKVETKLLEQLSAEDAGRLRLLLETINL